MDATGAVPGSRQQALEAELRSQPSEVPELQAELERIREKLADSEETLRAIRHGEVDALVVAAMPGQQQVFTLSNTDRPYRNFVENMSDGAATVSPEGIVLYANQALADLLASTCPQIVGQPLLDLMTDTSHRRLSEMLGPDSVGGSVEASLVTADAQTIPVLVGASSLAIDGDRVTCITVTDLTSERRAEAAAAHSAQHDALTGLPNRTLLADRIQHALDRRSAERSLLVLLFCDIDGFKNINDAYGHQVGDDILRTVANRLSTAVRPHDTVSRIGGDEFVILCEDLGDLTDAAAVAARVRAAIAQPSTAGTEKLDVTISIGIAVAEADETTTPDSLLRDADEAMYKAKRQGPNVIEMFDEQLRIMAESRLRLMSEMRHAEADGELRLHYQPVFSLHQEVVVGVEALIRWQHPTRGLVPPDEFIPYAERSGMITGIGAWVIREACHQAAIWTQSHDDPVPMQMSVNVSGRQLAQGAGLLKSVTVALEESGVDPTALVLEVTESALMDDAEAALRVVNELKELGVRIAIDDFGVGYSSLVYLKRFPVDLLKVDRSFVSGLGQDRDDLAIVHSVIELARAFGISAVAEGIETPEHLAILQRLGCEYGQGYLWSPAMPADDVEPRLFAVG
jgi:diguanylate cyclase (GGDEF)-like protein/PAS domain S-box-containing protein